MDNSELFHKHDKLDPDSFDFELYKIRSRIYALTALKVMKGENVCDLLSLLAHMLCFAADDCTLSPNPDVATNSGQDAFMLDLDEAKRMEKDYPLVCIQYRANHNQM